MRAVIGMTGWTIRATCRVRVSCGSGITYSGMDVIMYVLYGTFFVYALACRDQVLG